jgi:hypothetical protein
MRRETVLCVAFVGLLLPTTAAAQIPMPSGIPNPFDEHSTSGAKKPGARKADPVTAAQSRVDGLKAQLQAVRELSNWASTTNSELSKLYSDSLANLVQAQVAIYKAKGQAGPRYEEPKGFEVEPAIVTASSSAPSYTPYTVQTVAPDNFYIHVKAQFPDEWVKERKGLNVSYQIYSEQYLPMATTYQNTTNAVFRIYTYSNSVTHKNLTFWARVQGVSLPPGRYFVSTVIATNSWPRDALVSLNMFRVEGKLPSAVKVLTPHYAEWYSAYGKPKLVLNDAKATVKGKAITISGSYTREEFAKGQQPVFIEAVAESSDNKVVVLRQAQPLAKAKQTFGGKAYTVADHGLSPGTYTLRIRAMTEHPSSDSKWAYLTGSRGEKTVQITIP